jgi:hypothetical protein
MPKTQISVPGILVKTEHGPEVYRFHFFISQGNPNDPMFFTSPALREAIKQIPRTQLKKTRFGEINYHDYSTDTEPNTYEAYYQPLGNYQEYFKKKGISLALEKIALRELRKKVGNARITPFVAASEERANQLRKREIPLQIDKRGKYHYNSTIDELLAGIQRAEEEYKQTHRPLTAQERLKRLKIYRLKQPSKVKKILAQAKSQVLKIKSRVMPKYRRA